MRPSSFSLKRILTLLLLAGLFVWTKKDQLEHFFGYRSNITEPLVITGEDILLHEVPQIPGFPDMEELNEIEIPFEPLLEEQLKEHSLELEKQREEMEKFWKEFKVPVD
jgi:hypothetical protein